MIYHNRHQLYIEEETKLNVTYVSKEELLAKADFVSLNAPYTPETYHIIGEVELQQMKPSAILINTARGPLVDEHALVKALQAGTIHGAGLDVFEFGDYPLPELLEMDNVVLTPHIGTQTTETRVIMARAVANNVIGFIEGDRPVSRVLHPGPPHSFFPNSSRLPRRNEPQGQVVSSRQVLVSMAKAISF